MGQGLGTGVRYMSQSWDTYLTPVPVPDPCPGDFVLYLYLFLQLNEASIEKKCFMSENKV